MLHTKIVNFKKEKILVENAENFIKDFKFGASIYFLGTVRNTNDNKKVTGITYDSHDDMVIKSFQEIYNEANELLNIGQVTLMFVNIQTNKTCTAPQLIIDSIKEKLT